MEKQFNLTEAMSTIGRKTLDKDKRIAAQADDALRGYYNK